MEIKVELGDLFNFNKFLAPTLIKIVYWIGLFLIVLLTLMSITGMSAVDRMMGEYNSGFSVGGAILALLIGLVCAIVWRVTCEIWIVIFSINDRLGVLAADKKP